MFSALRSAVSRSRVRVGDVQQRLPASTRSPSSTAARPRTRRPDEWKTTVGDPQAGHDAGLAGGEVGGGRVASAGMVATRRHVVHAVGRSSSMARAMSSTCSGSSPASAELGERSGRQGVVRRGVHRCSAVGGGRVGRGSRDEVAGGARRSTRRPSTCGGPGDVVALGVVLAPVAAAGLLAQLRRRRPGRGPRTGGSWSPRCRRRARPSCRARRGRRGPGVQPLEGRAAVPGWRRSAARRRRSVMVRWIAKRASGASSGCAGSRGADAARHARAEAVAGRAAAMSSAMRSAKTRPSRSELEASRLAPWTPVQATSPHAYRPGTVVRPWRSVRTPPEA